MPSDAGGDDRRAVDALVAERRRELDEGAQRHVRRTRRVGRAACSLVVALAVLTAVLDGFDVVEVVGVDDAVVSATDGTTTLAVRYPSTSRPALASPLEITVTRSGGFDDPIELAIDADYLLLWDLNGVLPAPTEEVSQGDVLRWTFDPPEGDTLRVLYEARIEPARQEGAAGRVAVVDGSAALVAVEFETRLMP